jgi:hypothetical protein
LTCEFKPLQYWELGNSSKPAAYQEAHRLYGGVPIRDFIAQRLQEERLRATEAVEFAMSSVHVGNVRPRIDTDSRE